MDHAFGVQVIPFPQNGIFLESRNLSSLSSPPPKCPYKSITSKADNFAENHQQNIMTTLVLHISSTNKIKMIMTTGYHYKYKIIFEY